jgi:cyclopropane-fatty-acyl-phospholipid synthase
LRGRAHTPERDRAAISYHYDHPLAFYRTFLDENLVYSCAYFEDAEAGLEAAQLAKLDYVFRKVRLRPGQRLLDIGCGWGALAIRAAEKFGAHVLGVTLSETQLAEARRRIAERGLQERVRVELLDYRRIDAREPFDAIVSVGMAEHVGRDHLAEYFATAFKLLRPGGLFMNHAISDQSDGRRKRKPDAFIARYVFPDGELIPIGETLEVAERAGFEVRDVENLREHYHRTLHLWNERLLAGRDAAARAGGEAAYRIFRTYLAGSALAFSRGSLGLHQSLLAKPAKSGYVDIAPTRHELYAPSEQAGLAR